MTAIVSDHAVVRFLQRGCGFKEETIATLAQSGVDIDDVRELISTIVQRGVDNGAEGVTWQNLRFMLRGKIVTTVLTRSQFYCRHASLVIREKSKLRRYKSKVAA